MKIFGNFIKLLRDIFARPRAGAMRKAEPRSWELLAAMLEVQVQAGSTERIEAGYLPGSTRPENLDLAWRIATGLQQAAEAGLAAQAGKKTSAAMKSELKQEEIL